MTEKRFEFREINELPILPKCYDTEKQEYANLFECVDWLNELYRENEQLKSTIKDVVELLSEEVDLFSDKALEHDICAYIELKELDNKDAYYMAISTKKAIKMLKELEE